MWNQVIYMQGSPTSHFINYVLAELQLLSDEFPSPDTTRLTCPSHLQNVSDGRGGGSKQASGSELVWTCEHMYVCVCVCVTDSREVPRTVVKAMSALWPCAKICCASTEASMCQLGAPLSRKSEHWHIARVCVCVCAHADLCVWWKDVKGKEKAKIIVKTSSPGWL